MYILKQQQYFIFSLFQLKRKTRGKSDKLLSNQPFFVERDEFVHLVHLQKAAKASIYNGMSVLVLAPWLNITAITFCTEFKFLKLCLTFPTKSVKIHTIYQVSKLKCLTSVLITVMLGMRNEHDHLVPKQKRQKAEKVHISIIMSVFKQYM